MAKDKHINSQQRRIILASNYQPTQLLSQLYIVQQTLGSQVWVILREYYWSSDTIVRNLEQQDPTNQEPQVVFMDVRRLQWTATVSILLPVCINQTNPTPKILPRHGAQVGVGSGHMHAAVLNSREALFHLQQILLTTET